MCFIAIFELQKSVEVRAITKLFWLVLSNKVVVEFTAKDIPGAYLSEPLESHTVPSLRRWLLCHGIKVPASVQKQQLIKQ